MSTLASASLQFSRDARWVASLSGGRLALVGGAAIRALAVGAGVRGIAAFADQVWTIGDAGLERWALDGRALGEAIALAGDGVLAPALTGTPAAVWIAESPRMWLDDLGTFRELAIGAEVALPFAGRRQICSARGEVWLGSVRWVLPANTRLVAAAALFEGAGIALIVKRGSGYEAWTSSASGTVQQRIAIPAGEWRLAPRRGLLVVQTEPRRFTVIDLRFGRVLGQGGHATDIDDVAIDHDGTRLAIRDRAGELAIVASSDAIRETTVAIREVSSVENGVNGATSSAAAGEVSSVARSGVHGATSSVAMGGSRVATRDVEMAGAIGRETLVEALDGDPIVARRDRTGEAPAIAQRRAHGAASSVREALAIEHGTVAPPRLQALAPRAVQRETPRAVALAQLDRELELVGRWVLVAIAEGWNSRRLGYANESAHPYEHEVAAILGMNTGFAGDHVAAARAEADRVAAAVAGDPLRRGATTPIGAFAGELGLSQLAIDILVVVAAPAIWGDAARLYGILANDASRPIVDEQPVATILAPISRHDIARELDPRAPLVRGGAIQLAGERARPFAALVVDPVVVSRLRAELPDLGDAVAIRAVTTALDRIVMPEAVLAAALAALAKPTDTPVRIAVRGRPGAGRRTLLAAIVAEAGRELAVVDTSRLPRDPTAFASVLRGVLRRIHLAGLVPCVVGLDQVGFGERTVAEVAGDVLRGHPGALAIVAAADFTVPFDPGHVAIELPVLDETERLALWQAGLAEARLWVRDVAAIASRYRVGAGVIHRAIAAGALAGASIDTDASDAIEGYIRQTRDARLATLARRVDRTVTWASLVLPADVLDSLRELVGRVRHRRQVYETWGMGEALATARGITALFQGQPGTGKTLVVGVVARELGLDLYQVDLSKVMSKWIGETERNLATIFDAAEDGQVILLFDEADSLFAKRTEVRSSNDRYANLEVNYLLQRLDSFEGIAILTTNFSGSIDPAFKRRMSFRLSFPFPDEETRQQLWRVHLPPQLPIRGELALDRLARKYQLAGGYIRNACLRAAFLAAQEETALDQTHLERAVTLEFTELGKLSSSGAID